MSKSFLGSMDNFPPGVIHTPGNLQTFLEQGGADCASTIVITFLFLIFGTDIVLRIFRGYGLYENEPN